ncbi:MAG: RNA-binding protein [archaeon]|nr:RNA-binding protein [archaeon]
MDDHPDLELDGRNLGVNWAGDRDSRGGRDNRGGRYEDRGRDEEKTKTIFVGNLDYGTTEEDIDKLFSECGKIEAIRMAKDPQTDKPKGFCHIDFETEEDAEKALEKDGVELCGRNIKVDRPRPRGAGGRGGSRGGRGRGGRDYGRGSRGHGSRDYGHGGYRGDRRGRGHY